MASTIACAIAGIVASNVRARTPAMAPRGGASDDAAQKRARVSGDDIDDTAPMRDPDRPAKLARTVASAMETHMFGNVLETHTKRAWASKDRWLYSDDTRLVVSNAPSTSEVLNVIKAADYLGVDADAARNLDAAIEFLARRCFRDDRDCTVRTISELRHSYDSTVLAIDALPEHLLAAMVQKHERLVDLPFLDERAWTHMMMVKTALVSRTEPIKPFVANDKFLLELYNIEDSHEDGRLTFTARDILLRWRDCKARMDAGIKITDTVLSTVLYDTYDSEILRFEYDWNATLDVRLDTEREWYAWPYDKLLLGRIIVTGDDRMD